MNWNAFFNQEKNKPYWKELEAFWDKEYKTHVIYPARENIFHAFDLTPLENLKVVIFGQDPYHEPGQAMGLAFSVPDNIKTPPSLLNIYREIEDEYNTVIFDKSGDLTYLTEQGVLLINTILTVREHEPMSHNNKLYKEFLIDLVEFLNSIDDHIVFLLWGNNAKKITKLLNNPKHLIIETAHPSPLGANQGGWFGSGQFKKANEFLAKYGKKEINWLK